MNRTVRVILSSLIFILVVCGLIFGVHIAEIRAKDTAIMRASEVLTDSAREQSATLTAVLEGQFGILRSVAMQIDSKKYTHEEFDELLDSITYTGFTSIQHMYPDGKLTMPDGGIADYSDSRFFYEAFHGRESLEAFTLGSGETIVILSVPCWQGGVVEGAIVGIHAEKELRATLTSQVYGGQGYSLMVDSKGKIIINTESEYALFESGSIFDFYTQAQLGEGWSVAKLRDDMGAGKSCVFEYSFSGQSCIAAVVPFTETVLPELDWFVVNIIDGSELISEINSTKRNSMEVMWVFATFVMVSLVVFSMLEHDSMKKRKNSAKKALKIAESMRLNEEQFRIVAKQSGKNVYRYDIATGTVIGKSYLADDSVDESMFGKGVDASISSGAVAHESAEDYRAFFRKISEGAKNAEGVFLLVTKSGERRWYRHIATTLYDNNGRAKTAIVSYYDYTEQREREMAYLRWQQELKDIPENEIELYEWNISHDYAEDSRGLLVRDYSPRKTDTFDARSEYYCRKYVVPEDRHKFISVMNRDVLLGLYLDKCYSTNTDYRYIADDGKTIWMNISVQLVSYPDTQDIKAYIMNRDIDESKRRENELLDRSERDNITGVYNRATFIKNVEGLFESTSNAIHALIILDIDGFKAVNDMLGHAAGDRVLAEYADYIRSVLRVSDIVGRIGGDEFMICLPDMGDNENINRKSQQLCSLLRRKMNADLTISVSMGVTVYPDDGTSFKELYEKADAALYCAKNTGRNRFIRYTAGMEGVSFGYSEIDSKSDVSEEEQYDNSEYGSNYPVYIVGHDEAALERLRTALNDEKNNLITVPDMNEAVETVKLNSKAAIVILLANNNETDVLSFIAASRSFINLKTQILVFGSCLETGTQSKLLSAGADDIIFPQAEDTYISWRVKNAKERLGGSLQHQRLINRVNQQEKELQLTERDSLTGLYTRTAFLNIAGEIIIRGEPGTYALTTLDIDSFKVINDRFGIEVGDRLLRHMAEIFLNAFSGVGGLVGRVSADYFIALYPCEFLNSPEMFSMLERASVLPGSDLRVSLSAGTYIVNDLSLSVAAMQDRASLAKATVKGRYDIHNAVYSEDMRDTVLQRQEIINEMDAALREGQFTVWLQPQYNYSTGAIIGAEALVRWHHPKKGLILPSIFVPVFEQNGFIYRLDKFVWEQVCILLRRCYDDGEQPVPISVNVSRYDIFMSDFFECITGLLQKYELPAKLLRIEITETAFSTSPEQIISMVKRLREYGFIIEIDDFGSGYSSLNIIKNVSADILKLDMKFIEDDDGSKRAGNVLESIIRMAKWLEMSVIAEGVETHTQAEFLKSVGCVYMQGYFYSRPVPVEDCKEWIRLGNATPESIPMTKINIYDNNAFWDPNSIETLIFNSYIGGAAVYEYRNGEIEVLRVNNRYMEVLGSELDASIIVNIDPKSYFDAENYNIMIDAVLRAKESGEEVTYETMRVIGSGENEHREYIRSRVRMIANSEDSLLLYVIIENTTKARLREQMLEETTRQLSFLNDAARELITQGSEDEAIVNVLKKVLAYFSGWRAYIFEFDYKNETASNTYEVCKAGVSAEIENLQNVPFAMVPFWLDAFKKRKYISIASTAELDDSRREERESLLAQNINSLVAVPVYNGETLVGLVGVDNPLQHDMNIEQLVAIGKYIAVMLTKRNANKNKLSE